MENIESKFSHRNCKSKFVRIDAEKRDNNGGAIITCEKDKMEQKVKQYQKLGYKVTMIREI